jgi:hypothetical protein
MFFNLFILKRPSDFIVNEVDSNGKVVRLTNFNLPIDINKKAQEEQAHIDNLEENVFISFNFLFKV